MFSPEVPIQEIAMEDHALAFFLRRYVKDGRWDVELGELCERERIDIDFFTDILSYLIDPDTLNKSSFLKSNSAFLVRFLKDGHRYFLNTSLPEIHLLISHLYRAEQVKWAEIWSKFIQSYQHHLMEHFQEEEKCLFPLAVKIDDGSVYMGKEDIHQSKKYISSFIQEHMEEELEIRLLRKSLVEYQSKQPSLQTQDRLILYMSSLEKDLLIHDLIEEEVLIPRMSEQLRLRKAQLS